MVVVGAVSDPNIYGCLYLKITLHGNLSLLILFQIPILTAVLFLILDDSQSSTHYGFITKLTSGAGFRQTFGTLVIGQ